ncbi:MAG TPA: ABC transporter permease, partial [Gemmatales bacterium]|nr:ABC transporter permease [Gemmatales bacterium]
MLGPIFNREALTVPRHSRHYLLRSLYLALLLITGVTFWQTLYGWGRSVTLGDISHFGVLFFQLLCFLQLTLVIFFSALLAASTVAQEKDRRTFVLLLMTDLYNYELVLGKLLGSLMQISILLLAALPVLGASVLLGGTTFLQVIDAFLILFGSALAAGSLGCLVALWRDRTFQTLAVTVLVLVMYLVLVEGLGILAVAIPQYESSIRLLSLPFFFAMLTMTVLLNLLGIMMLRVWNPSNERMRSAEEVEDESEKELETGRNRHAAPGTVRAVWKNP